MSGICIGVKEKYRYFLEEESFDLGCKIKKKKFPREENKERSNVYSANETRCPCGDAFRSIFSDDDTKIGNVILTFENNRVINHV